MITSGHWREMDQEEDRLEEIELKEWRSKWWNRILIFLFSDPHAKREQRLKAQANSEKKGEWV